MTVKQKQCLLTYLGYYEGGIDGIWGELSRSAARKFQKEQELEESGVLDNDAEQRLLEAVCGSGQDNWWDDIRYFSRKEFACKCGRWCDGYPTEMQRAVVETADRARAYFGAPAVIVSGLRCPQHNLNVGGVENSQHMYGEAVDFYVQGVSAEKLLEYVQAQPEIRYAYAISQTNVHMDIPKGER